MRSMSNFIKNLRLNVASWANKNIVDLTEDSQIRSLIDSLHPIASDKKLVRMGSSNDGGYLLPDDL